ncbi:MAG: hypothetical protein L3J39_08450 [Verrucomicrobiales bacterium]|nr:hypothetical protein [Verrucomicrobiales bacterium]
MNLLNGKTKYLAVGSWALLVVGCICFFTTEVIWSVLFILGGFWLRTALPIKNYDPDRKSNLSHSLKYFGVFFLVSGICQTPLIKSAMHQAFNEIREASFPLPALYIIGGLGCLISRVIFLDYKYLKSVPEADIERYYKLKAAEQEPAPNP